MDIDMWFSFSSVSRCLLQSQNNFSCSNDKNGKLIAACFLFGLVIAAQSRCVAIALSAVALTYNI